MKRFEYKRVCKTLDRDPSDQDAQHRLDQWVSSIDRTVLCGRGPICQGLLVVHEAFDGDSIGE